MTAILSPSRLNVGKPSPPLPLQLLRRATAKAAAAANADNNGNSPAGKGTVRKGSRALAHISIAHRALLGLHWDSRKAPCRVETYPRASRAPQNATTGNEITSLKGFYNKDYDIPQQSLISPCFFDPIDCGIIRCQRAGR